MIVWIVAMAAVFTGNLVKGVTGFGSAIVAIPLLGLVVPAGDAMALVAATDVVTGLGLVASVWGQVRWRVVGAMVVPLFVAQWWATDQLASWSPAGVRVVVALLVAAFATGLVVRPIARPRAADHRADGSRALAEAALSGFGAGLTSGFAGMPGPPLVVWTRRHTDDLDGRAILLAVFVPSAVALVSMLVSKGVVEGHVLTRLLGMVPAALLGSFVGARLSGRVPPARFGRLVGIVLWCAVLGMLWA